MQALNFGTSFVKARPEVAVAVIARTFSITVGRPVGLSGLIGFCGEAYLGLVRWGVAKGVVVARLVIATVEVYDATVVVSTLATVYFMRAVKDGTKRGLTVSGTIVWIIAVVRYAVGVVCGSRRKSRTYTGLPSNTDEISAVCSPISDVARTAAVVVGH